MRTAVAIIILCCSVPACREVQPFESSRVITGYELHGTVTTPNGIPLDSVSVWLSYVAVPVSYIPLDTMQVIVKDSTKIVYVAVYSSDFRYVHRLFLGYRSPGPVPRFKWNEQDDSGHYVPSGKYFIQYVYDASVVKVVPYLAEGHRTAMTNSSGEFVLSNDRLPVGELFDFYTNDGTYDATYQVLPEIELVFTRGTLQPSSYDVSLDQNKITRGVFKLG